MAKIPLSWRGLHFCMRNGGRLAADVFIAHLKTIGEMKGEIHHQLILIYLKQPYSDYYFAEFKRRAGKAFLHKAFYNVGEPSDYEKALKLEKRSNTGKLVVKKAVNKSCQCHLTFCCVPYDHV